MLANGGAGAVSTSLDQNAPNPFVVSASGVTTIGFTLAQPENVTMRVFDLLGHEVRTIISDEGRAAGQNTVAWDGRDASGNIVPSGLYYYQLVTADFTQTAKMQVTR
jgi:flagellar hook assembly protein FlgD